MRNIVKATERYLREAKMYNCTKVFDRFKAMAEKPSWVHANNDEYGFDDYIKKEHRNFRSVFHYRVFNINNEEIRCYLALRVFKRGDAEYSRFHSEGRPKKERDTITGLSAVEWGTIQKEIERDLYTCTEPRLLPYLNDAEASFIQRENGITQEIFDIPIYESKDWVETVQRDDFEDSFKVATAIENEIYLKDNPEEGFREIPYGSKGENILCFRWKKTDNKDCWFLLGLGAESVIRPLRKQCECEIEASSPNECLMNKCRRAYPLTVFDDKDFWAGMEKDRDSNFILSDEEIGIVSKPQVFPLFISGRAGSGKSTVLQYLFAEFLLRHLGNEGVKPPAYISYSSNLIENAKKLSASLFGKNHAYLKQLKIFHKDFKTDVEPLFGTTFFVFQQLIRDCIGEKNKTILNYRFPDAKRVSYTKYRELWTEKFGREPRAAKECGPALSWHVIRTYIKGWDSEGFLEPETYNQIGKNNKSVSDQTFNLVFEKIWTSWYQKLQEQEGLWDDQDLVRYCLAPDDDSCETCVTERFSAILCDESQDFTQIETEFILRLSVFSNRRIHDANMLRKLPFVFAGDEFQTLNPTGFSWDSLRSYFTRRLIHATEFGQDVGAPEPVVLTRNYRSTAPIVKLGNRLQLLRQSRCGGDARGVPQVPYYAENNADSVYCLRSDNPLVWKKLGEMGVILIVPSADGQSVKEYIDESSIKGMIEFYEDGASKNITIYNPIQAKGLDYPCVAVYGFDPPHELTLRALINWFNQEMPQSDNEAQEIELKYFLSNAYVSVTRAKRKLFIISEFTDNSFWAFAFSTGDSILQSVVNTLERKMLGRLKNQNAWNGKNEKSMLGLIIEGDVGSVTDENIVNAGEVAKTTEDRGMDLRDAGLMRQAAARYREREKHDDVQRCEAYAYLFEKNHSKAAETFEQAKCFDKAVRCYWLGYTQKNGADTLRKIAILQSQTQRPEVHFACESVKEAIMLNNFKRDLDSAVSLFSGKEGIEMRDEALETRLTWQSVLSFLFNKLTEVTSVDLDDVRIIIQLCEALKTYEIALNVDKQAMLAFQVKDYNTAIALWDSLQQSTKNREYHQAKSYILSYPDNLSHLAESGMDDWQKKSIEAFRSHPDIDLLPAQKRILGEAVLNIGTEAEIKSFLPFILNGATNRNQAGEIIKASEKRIQTLPAICLDILFQVRWLTVDRWIPPKQHFISGSANDLLAMFSALKDVRSPKFLNEINERIKTIKDSHRRRISDMLEEYFGKFTRTVWGQLLFIEIGIIFEKRAYFIDAIHYYNWAINQSDNSDFKTEIWTRWIVCKERLAKRGDENSAEHAKEALLKRKELSIVPEVELPEESKFERWEWLFGEALKLNEQIQPVEIMKPVSALEPSDARKQTASPPPDNKSASISISPLIPQSIASSPTVVAEAHPDKVFEYNISGYMFRFNPAKSELSIAYQTASEDLYVKIRNKKFPDEADFALNGTVLQKANGGDTPFTIIFSQNAICMKIVESGLQLVFPCVDATT